MYARMPISKEATGNLLTDGSKEYLSREGSQRSMQVIQVRSCCTNDQLGTA